MPSSGGLGHNEYMTQQTTANCVDNSSVPVARGCDEHCLYLLLIPRCRCSDQQPPGTGQWRAAHSVSASPPPVRVGIPSWGSSVHPWCSPPAPAGIPAASAASVNSQPSQPQTQQLSSGHRRTDFLHILTFQTLKFWKSVTQSNITIYNTFMCYSKERDYLVIHRTYSCTVTDSIGVVKCKVRVCVCICVLLLCSSVFFYRHDRTWNVFTIVTRPRFPLFLNRKKSLSFPAQF